MKLYVKRIIFIAILCLGALVVTLFRWPLHFQTDLNSLVNLGTDAEWPVKEITNKFSSVINIVVQSNDKFSGELVTYKIRDIINSDKFNRLEIMSTDLSMHSVISELGKYRNGLLSINDRQLLQRQDFDKIIDNAVSRVENSMMPNMLPLSQDPFLLFTDYILEIGDKRTGWMPKNGLLWQYRSPYNFYMLPIYVNGLNSAELAECVKQIKRETRNMESENVKIYMGGAPVHTADMYNRSKIEISIISFLALIAVVVLNYLLFRRMKTIIPVMASLAIGYLFGTIALFLCFGAPHILVFVFGTSLIGLGIDYAFHFMYVENGVDSKTTHKNILYSLITTIICFVPLLFANVALLRQIAVFTIVGLVAIYAFIRLFISYRIDVQSKQSTGLPIIKHKYRPYIIGGIIVFSIIACAFVRIENNISAMYRPFGDLANSEKIIGELNQSAGIAILVVRGNTMQDVLETEEQIKDNGTDFFGLSSIIPSVERQKENQNMIEKLYISKANKIKHMLELKKIPKFTSSPEIYDNDIKELDKQIKNFVLKTNNKIYSISSVPIDAKINNDNAKIIIPVHQIQHQIELYTNETYKLLVACGAMLLIVLVALYRGRAFRYLAPPLLGVLLSLGVLGIFGISITFFHLLGLFIVIGLGLDYAIFHINKDTELRPVFYSFLTSFIGFGMLAFTSFFLVSAMGTILALGIAGAYFLSLYLFRD